MWRAIATASKKFGSQVSLFRDDGQRFKFLSLNPAAVPPYCVINKAQKSKIRTSTHTRQEVACL